jgi:thioredoxin-like negative regulator of GroEL
LIEPTLEKFAEDYKDVVCVTKFDIQDRLSQQFKVELLLSGLMPQALPTLLLFYKGKVLTKWRGIIRYEQLEEMVEEYVTPLDFAVKSNPKSTADHNITDPNP